MFLLLAIMLSIGQYSDVLQVKKRFYEAVNKPELAEEMVEFFSSSKIQPADERYAWFAAAEALTAKNASAPWTKVSISKSALGKLQKAIDARPNDPYPSFLRMSVEKELPGFLGMSEHLDRDRSRIGTLLENMAKRGECGTPRELSQAMIKGGYCNKTNGSMFYTLLKQCNTN